MTDIYIVDTETTGLQGAISNEKIVEIAICKVNTETLIVERVFESIVGQEIPESEENAWIFSYSNLTPDMVRAGPSDNEVIITVNEILKNRLVTSFNVGFDFYRFLDMNPWKVPYKKTLPCIMLSATEPCAIPNRYSHEYKWPSLDEAYSHLVNGKDNDLYNGTPHRAMSDCYKSAQVLVSLIKSNNYIIN